MPKIPPKVVEERSRPVKIAIGERIHELRKMRKLSQRQLATLTGVERANLIKYEQGKGNATIDTLTKFAIALGVDLVVILGPEEPSAAPGGVKDTHEQDKK